VTVYSKFFVRLSFLKLAFLAILWFLGLLVSPQLHTLFPGEAFLIFLLYLVAQYLGIRNLLRETSLSTPVCLLLFLSDAVFALYLTKFFIVAGGYLFILFLGLIILESIQLGAAFGLLFFLISVATLILLTAKFGAQLELLPSVLIPGSLPMALIALGIILLVSGVLAQAFRRIISEADRMSAELTRTMIDGEIAKEDLIRTNRHVATLLKISESLSSSLEPKELVANFESALHESVPFDNFSVFIYDNADRNLKLLASRGEVFSLADAPTYSTDFGIAGAVFNSGRPLLIEDVDACAPDLKKLGIPKDVESLVSVPLFYRDEIVGVLTLDSSRKGNFKAQQLRLVEGLAPLLAVAINNLVQFLTIKVASTRDKLTNLYNYFAFTQRFQEVIESCYHLKKPLTLLMMDIDDFKNVNDTYGHLTGNQVLMKIGEILSQFFRRSDVISRYGGEEFAVVLNRTPIEVGLVLAENLREEVERFPFQSLSGEIIGVTLSIGVASLDDEGIILEEKPDKRGAGDAYLGNTQEVMQKLIQRADEALYESKNRGKNRVTASRFSKYPYKEFTEHKKTIEAELPSIERKIIKIDPRA